MVKSPVSTDSIREAVGNGSVSRKLHDSRNNSYEDGNIEQYTADCRQYRSWSNKSIVLAGIQGCSMAAASLALMHATAKSGNFCTVGTLCKAAVLSAIPTGLALAFTTSSGIFHERRFQELERTREEWELQNYVDGEREEMIHLYQARGVSQEDATTIVDILLKDEKIFLDLMMMEELGYSKNPPPNNEETMQNVAIPVSGAFIVCFLVPHLPKILMAKGCHGDSCASRVLTGVVAGEVVLALQTVGLSILQSRLLLGVYTDTAATAKAAVANGAWIASMFGLTTALFHASAKLWKC